MIRRFASNPVLTHMGAVRCNMLTGALVPRWGTVAGVPGPRRNADECDAGWFAPVATRRRPFLFVRSCRYSVLLNSAMATDIIVRPMTATIPSASHCGTGQPAQVSPGASACCSNGESFRCLNTASRIGPTT